MNNHKKQGQLKSYSALATAFIAISNVGVAQMVYTDVDPDTTIDMNGESYDLDLNGDGNADFKIKAVDYSAVGLIETGGGNTFTGLKEAIYIDPLNGSVGAIAESSGIHPYVFNSCDALNNTIHFSNVSNQALDYYLAILNYPTPGAMYPFDEGGFWNGLSDRFVGLKLEDAGTFYYGWVRLDVSSDHHTAIIKDYAYEFQAETSMTILCDEAIIDENLSIAEIFANGNTIHVQFDKLPSDDFTINIFNLLGEKIADIPVEKLNTEITFDQPTGVYLVVVRDLNRNICVQEVSINQ